ncbi:MAG: radical SAM protein [Oscillospiraceae bacterium]|nr:radical SAM protein [Oscillospiraceae bacterium]
MQTLTCCEICPRGCKVNRLSGEIGFCGADAVVKIARADLHFWEEPCISGENGSGTVFFSSCNMKCIFCQNFPISTCNKGVEMSVAELCEKFLALQKKGANNINLVTPTHYVLQIIAALDLAKGKGLDIPVVYNSGGYESVSTIKRLSGYVDIYMPDIKYFSDKAAVEYSSAPDYFNIASDALSEMVKQVGKPVFDEKGIMKKGVIVRHMMLPGLLSDTRKIIDYLYDTYGDDIFISLMSQYTPMESVREHPKLCRRIDPKSYDTVVKYCMDKGIKNAFIQSGASASESFIPDFEI